MSKLEVEVKILEIDQALISSKLEKLGAQKTFDGYLEAIYFIYDNIVDKNSALRLRKESDTTYLTHKKKSDSTSSKSYIETEIIVNDFEETLKLVSNLGYTIYNRNRKHRVSYSLEQYKFEIDTYLDNYSHIPTFLEIEVNNDKHIKSALSLLDIDSKKVVNFNFFELIGYYENN